MKPTAPGIQDCPGLKITANAGIFFTDCLQRVHDMEQQVWRTPIEAAGDVRLSYLGIRNRDNAAEYLRILMRQGELYPIFKRNDRVLLIADCALADLQARHLQRRPLRHLAQTRAQHVA